MGAINAVTDLSVEDGIAIITINNPPVNALGHAVRDGIVGLAVLHRRTFGLALPVHENRAASVADDALVASRRHVSLKMAARGAAPP